jgi:DNA-binding transcriptional regulator YbjK
VNQERRDRLRDAAIEVLAEAGGRGLTHRAVDAVADVPVGTTKNYFPTRDALLASVAERCVELYRQVPTQPPTDRESLAAMLCALLENVAGPGRSRLLAISELRCEAARKPWLAALLDEVAAADFAAFEHAQRAAGLPVTPYRAAVVTLAQHAAIPHLLAGGPDTLTAAGLNDRNKFVHDLLDTIYGPPE